jgi:heparosan-N-sulfate-glucuronate 5-epimerase
LRALRRHRYITRGVVTGLVALASWLVFGAGVSIAKQAARERLGVYQTFGELPRDWKSPYPLVDGIPMVNYGTFQARNPVTSAQYGLANYSLWIRYGDHFRWLNARRVADWLVRTQHHNGEWEYSFPEPAPGSTETLAPGWGSALAQGQAMSLLERVYRRTHKASYLKAIQHALKPLQTPVSKGGLGRRLDNGIYFEEYPTHAVNFSLNGDLQTLIGVYDVADLVPAAQTLFTRAVRTVADNLGAFDSHAGYSYYSLASRTPCPPGYNPAIRSELRILAAITRRKVFTHYARIWNAP